MAEFEKHFTLTEANDLIPWVRSVFQKVRRILREAKAQHAASGHEAGRPGNGHGGGNGHGRKEAPADSAAAPAAGQDAEWAGLSVQEKVALINGLLGAVREAGIVIQDVDRGLIDFPGWHADEEVLLCYELNDGQEIGYWHHLRDGYAGRQPIDDLIRR